MPNKIFIHTQLAKPNEDFVEDVQIPLNAKKINGILINAFDRTNGLIIKSEKERTYTTPVPINDFVSRNEQIIKYFALELEIACSKGATELDILAKRDEFLKAVIDLYNNEIIELKHYIFNEAYLISKKEAFITEFLNPPYTTIDANYNLPSNIREIRNELGLPVEEGLIGFKFNTLNSKSALHFEAKSIGSKIWDPVDLKNYYLKLQEKIPVFDQMAVAWGLSEEFCRDGFFANDLNFQPGSYLQSWVGIDEGKFGLQKRLAYSELSRMYGEPDAFGYKFTGQVSTYSVDINRSAILAINYYANKYIKTFVKSDKLIFDWDKSAVGELSVLFNSGRDATIRDFPVSLNDNTIKLHHNLIKIHQNEQVNSFVRMVFKNNGKSINPFNVKTYFFYET